MCTVSMVFDYGRRVWPEPYPAPPPFSPWPFPNVAPSPDPLPTKEEWEAFWELVEKARKFDELTGQPDCEDPQKSEWVKAIEARLDRLEGDKEDGGTTSA